VKVKAIGIASCQLPSLVLLYSVTWKSATAAMAFGIKVARAMNKKSMRTIKRLMGCQFFAL
jgi:hypothetical protein